MKVKYSSRDKELMDLVRKAKTIDSTALIKSFYKDGSEPFHARASINSAMRSLISKMEHNKEKERIVASPPRGPYPIEYSWNVRP